MSRREKDKDKDKDKDKEKDKEGFFRRPWKSNKKPSLSPSDAMILLETFEEKIFICNSNGTVVLSSLGSKVKGWAIEEAIASFHSVPQSYSQTLRRCIQLVCQSSQKIWFQTPLLDYEHQTNVSSSSLVFSAEITTTIKPFRKIHSGDGGSVAVTVSFIEQQSSNGNPSFGYDRPTDLDLNSFTSVMDSANIIDHGEFLPHYEPTYNFSLDGVYRSIAKALAETFQMRYGWVARIVETAPWRVQIVAFWDDKQQGYIKGLEYDLEGSFWGLVGQNDGPVCYPNNASTLFPNDTLLTQYQIDSLVFSSARATTDATQTTASLWIGAMNTSPTSWQQHVLKSLLTAMTQKVEEQLSKLKKQHHYWMSDQVLKQMSDAVIILDTTGKVLQWKGTAEQLFCMKAEEVRGNTIQGLLAQQENFDEFTQWLGKASSQNGAFVAERDAMKREISFRKKDGSGFEGEMSCKIIRLDIPILVLIVVRDVTERIRRNEELKTLCGLLEKSRDDALAGIRMKSLFLANVSHEIRTPMNAIIGMTQLLLDTELTSLQRELVEDIRISGDHLIAIINDILDISKLEAGKVVLEKQEISVQKCIEDAYRLTSRSFPNSKVVFESEIKPGVPNQIIGDSTRLTQILINLLSNAMKFTQQGYIRVAVSLAVEIPPTGPSVATPPAYFGDSRDPGTRTPVDDIQLLFVIQDSGIGIPAHALDRIFEPFEQSDTSSIRKYGGTGLGLSICARLVQCMGGKIWAESKQENGSTFSFTIRATTVAARSPANYNSRSPSSASATASLNLVTSPLTSEELQQTQLIQRLQQIELQQQQDQMPNRSLTNSSSVLSRSLTDSSSEGAEEKNPKSIARQQLCSSTSPKLGSGVFSANLSELSILVAEDNLMNQKVILKLLSKIGCNADLAGNGVEAVEAVTKKHYDVVFMDVQMPEMDGIEATRRISQMPPHPNHEVPVIIALTANVCEPDQILRYHQAGMIHILAKPIKLNLLQETLKNLPAFFDKMMERDRLREAELEQQQISTSSTPTGVAMSITPSGSPSVASSSSSLTSVSSSSISTMYTSTLSFSSGAPPSASTTSTTVLSSSTSTVVTKRNSVTVPSSVLHPSKASPPTTPSNPLRNSVHATASPSPTSAPSSAKFSTPPGASSSPSPGTGNVGRSGSGSTIVTSTGTGMASVPEENETTTQTAIPALEVVHPNGITSS